MKIKIKQTFRSMWATILAVLMLLSTFSAVAVTLNTESTGATTLSSETVLFFEMEQSTDGKDWWNNDTCYHYVKISGASGTSDQTVHLYDVDNPTSSKSGSQYYFCTIPAGTYDKISFYRGKTADTLSDYYNNADNVISVDATNNAFGIIYNENFGIWQSWYTKQLDSTVSLTDNVSGSAETGTAITLTPSLTSNTNFNVIKSNSYVVKDDNDNIVSEADYSISDNTITFNKAGTYTITDTITYNAKGYADITKTAQASTTITVNSASPTSYTFPKGTTIYYDFTAYSGGYNYITADGQCNDNNKQYNDNVGDNKKIVSVTLTKPFTVKTDTVLFKTGPDGNWKFRTISTLPTEGQNMIVCSSDGITAHWATYNDSSPVATELTVSVTSSSPYYVNVPITLNNTATLTSGVDARNVTYSYEYSTDNSNWNAITGTTFTPSSAGTYYFRVKASAEGYEDFISKNEAKVTVSNRMYKITKAGTTNGSFDTEPASEASAGATVTINITPNPGYEVNAVQVVKTGEGSDGQTVAFSGSGNTYTFQMPEYDVTVSVTFKLKDYTMTGKADPSTFDSYVKCYDASDAEISTATKGQTVKFVANAVSGYSVTGWTVTGVTEDKYTVSSDKKSVEVTVETSNVTATANYVGDSYTVTQKTSSNGTYTVTGVTAGKAQYGSPVTINPEPATGFVLDSITVNKTGDTTTTVPVTNNSFTMPAYNVTITVTFKSNPGTASNKKFLYKVDSNDPSLMTALSGTVYENPTGTYTLTITDTSTISSIVSGNNSYFALSDTELYTGMHNGSTADTETKTYVSSTGIQPFNKDGVDYKFLRASFYNKEKIKSIQLIFDSTTSKYIINAYDTSSDKTPLADGVTLTANPTTQTIGKKVTLTATLNNVNAKIPTGAEFTYTFYRGSEELGTAPGTNVAPIAPVTFDTTYNTASTQRYTVTVSTKVSSPVDHTPTDYESVTSNPVSVEYSDVVYYYAAVNPETGDVGTRAVIPPDNKVETTVSDGGTYYFSVFDNDTDTSPESVVDYTVDSANNRYCTISKSSTETGLDYLIVKCNAKCSNPVIYFDKANKTVYAVATQNVGSSKTLDSEKKVTYYFAEERYDSTGASNPKNGENGMRIKYWNNSVDKYDYADVTTPVNVAGIDKDGNVTNCNSIFVRVDKFAGISSNDIPSKWNNHLQREFYIYSVELPIWATSFNFVSSSNTALTVDNTSQTGNSSCSSIVLNPNRIYCLFYNGTKNFVRGVVLDESMWSNETRGAIKSNEVTTQGFASNLVNYKTVRNNGSGNVDFNTALTTHYGTDYEHPLYFNGWYDNDITKDTRTLYGSSYFRLHDNLAMRKSYFASVQNLTDNKLSTTKKNKMGNGYLLGYNGNLMPLFDYKMLNDNKTTLVNNGQLYENVQFPFYASTFNGVTTYSYDSTTDRNRLVDTSGSSPTVKVSDGFVNKGSSYGYFPFGGTDNYDTFGSGTEFDINFYMTNNGKLSNGDDIAFNFSGDDDVWVYVDGVRVLDLGGAHSVSSGTINFSDMKVYYKTAANATDKITNCNETWVTDSTYVKTVSLTDLFEANGVSFSNTDASTQHTLQMFYLERGQGESNCSISFNLPQNTGFRVNSNVTTDSVNEALVEDTMTAANKDYFNYQIANKLATATEYTNVSTTFTNAPARAENVSGLTPSDTPSYPINSPLISRDFLGTNYYLTATNATPSASDNGWLSSVNIENIGTFTTLKNVNYTLSDAYAVKGASDTESSPTGRVSGTGIFNLLFGQSAIFESKIPNNTMIQLSQDDIIRKVNAGDGDTTVITAGDASTRTVSNYYSSSYSIVDDNTGLELANKTQSVTDGKLYANDASANSNMFYFANYSGETNTSSNAMTVTYTNDVLTSKIKLAKYVENPSATDNFYFKVEFSKIFGEALTTAKEYTDLQYTVYNSSDDKLVATRTYGKAGVYFTANQYAIIEGVPVDSAYNVVEKDRAGYKFDRASKTTYKGDTEDTTTNYNDNKVDGATVSGANGTTTYDVITFKNSKQAFTVNFKYYDRSVITGTTSHISTSPTIVTYSYDSVTNEYLISGSVESDIKYNLPKIISDAYAHYNFDNLIDTYTSFTSQTEAETAAGSFKVIREGIDDVKPGETTYSQAYGSKEGVNLGLHYDCYGRPQGTDDCKVSDGEKWVTYYAGNTPISQTDAEKAGSRVNSITVWLYNTLKEYKPTFYYANATNNDGQLNNISGTDKYVATNKSYTISKDVYYNVRLGKINGNAQNDAATDYLKEYGINKGYCDEVPNIVTDVTYTDENSVEKSLKFLYWASDSKGKNILSTDVAYGYRVTNNLKAYAVYGVNDFNAKGLTITPNTPDYYSNSTGKSYIRLNNVMNVYGCPERDTNIKNASVFYIIDYSTNNAMDKLLATEGGFKALQEKVRKVVNKYKASQSFVEGNDIVIQTNSIEFKENSTGDIDITGFNHKVVPYNEALNPGTDDIKLTNKNRVQFTTSFTKSNLKDLKMYAMLGMDYSEVVSGKNDGTNSWIVSDNLLYYAFDTSGNVTSIKDPILDYTFYSTAP
ncbi:MAG: hypothetical protein PUC69_00440 [Ruminococcus sp.]|nr:hypothetical protein [Ruminococcus sp.]MDD5889070.1 hypothetical protein [Ruminococcus sp.]